MPGLLAAVSHPEQAAMEIALDILDPMQIPGASLSDTQVAQFFALMGISIESQLLDDLLKETWGWVRGRQFYLQDLLQVYTWWRGVGCTRLPAPPEMTTLAVGNSNVDPSFVLAASLSRSKSSKSLDSEEKDVVNEAEEVDPLIDREDRVLASKYAALRRTRMAINPIVGYDEEVTQQLTQQHTQSIVDQLHHRLQQQLEAKDEKAVAEVAEMGIAVSAAVPKVAASDGDDDDESPNKSKNSSLEHYGSLVGTTNTAMGLPWYNPIKYGSSTPSPVSYSASSWWWLPSLIIMRLWLGTHPLHGSSTLGGYWQISLSRSFTCSMCLCGHGLRSWMIRRDY
jgi:hypothetical protein